MVVFVINNHGEPLMPCKPRKARLLLKDKKAKVVSRAPFQIQLLYETNSYTQEVKIGVDLGAKHVGIAITSEAKVLAKGEIELRQDVKSNLGTRKIYRRSRRNRKTRYRKPRFQNRNREKGWLPPSIQSRMENTFFWVDKFCDLVPNPVMTIEVGKFDVQKMMNPAIAGAGYQEGQTYGYHDVRYFVFARDQYTCQVCKQKGEILNTHHLIYRSYGGSNRVDNLVTVCTDCHTHENHQSGNVLWKWMTEGKRLPQYKEGPFMNSFRRRVFAKYPDAQITYGSMTTPKRKELGLEKTHANDAIAISGISSMKENSKAIFRIKQFRKKKRSLHEATARKGRTSKNRTSKRNEKNKKFLKGFYLNDKVTLYEKTGYITGFTGTSGAYVKTIDGDYITMPNKSYKQVGIKELTRISHNNNWQFEYKAFG